VKKIITSHGFCGGTKTSEKYSKNPKIIFGSRGFKNRSSYGKEFKKSCTYRTMEKTSEEIKILYQVTEEAT